MEETYRRSDPGHDIRWCSRCEALEAGYHLAADLIEQWAKAEEEA